MGGISTFTAAELEELRIFDAEIDRQYDEEHPRRKRAPKKPETPRAIYWASYYNKHHEERIAKDRAYRAAHREELRAYDHERYLKRKAKQNEQS